MRIAIAAIDDVGTTARYLEDAAEACGHDVTRLRSLDDPSAIAGADCLLVVDPFLRSPEALLAAPCPVLGYLIDVHQHLPVRLAYARYFTHVFVAQPDYLQDFEALPHRSVRWVPLACDPGTHFVAEQERVFEIGFVGKMGKAGSERERVLSAVLSQFRTNEYSRHYAPKEMGAVYSASKVVFNKSINGDVNMRVFEALASGALLVTDKIANGLQSIGEEGKHYITYGDATDAIDKIRYYLSHEEERVRIASEGQRHAFAHHTYQHRLEAMLEVLVGAAGSAAPARAAPQRTEALWRSECMLHQGAGLRSVGRLLGEGNLSAGLVRNAATAAARGIVRPLRQAWARKLARR